MVENKISCTFTGQSLIDRPVSPTNESKYNELRDWIAESEVRFTNLEVVIVGDRARWPMKTQLVHRPGGDTLDQLKEYGFNIFSLANNHSWDFAYDGILDTIDAMESRSLTHAGTGRNLEAAQEPAYLETPNGTVALVAMAGGNLPRAVYQKPLQFPSYATPENETNRPGINPLKADDYYQLPSDSFDRMTQMAEEMNSQGFTPEFYRNIETSGDTIEFLGNTFVRGDEYGMTRKIRNADRERNLSAISEAKENADMVITYLHQHYWENNDLEVGEWHREFAKECIDAGSDCFVTHGVPKLLPMEMYDNCPIFYSLGNFIYHTSSAWPDQWGWQSAAIRGNFEEGEWTELKIKPVTLVESDKILAEDFDGSHYNAPMATDQDHAQIILERFQNLSEPFGTEITIEDDVGRVVI